MTSGGGIKTTPCIYSDRYNDDIMSFYAEFAYAVSVSDEKVKIYIPSSYLKKSFGCASNAKRHLGALVPLIGNSCAENVEMKDLVVRDNTVHLKVSRKNGSKFAINVGYSEGTTIGEGNEVTILSVSDARKANEVKIESVSGAGVERDENYSTTEGNVTKIVIYFYYLRGNVIRNDPNMFPTALRRSGSCKGARYDNLIKTIAFYQDNGMFDEIERYKDSCMREFEAKGDIDLQVVLRVLYADMGIYHTDSESLHKSRTALEAALKLAETGVNHQFLIGMCLARLGYLYAAYRDFDKAEHYLHEAEAVLKVFASDEVKAKICFVYGNIYAKKCASSGNPLKEDEINAIKSYKLYARHSVASEDPDLIKKGTHWSILKQINIYLRSYIDDFRRLPVTEENLTKAKSLLDSFKEHHLKDASKAANVYYIAHLVDYFCRTGQFETALDTVVKEGAPAAKDLGHKFMMQFIDKRQKVLRSLIKTDE